MPGHRNIGRGSCRSVARQAAGSNLCGSFRRHEVVSLALLPAKTPTGAAGWARGDRGMEPGSLRRRRRGDGDPAVSCRSPRKGCSCQQPSTASWRDQADPSPSW